MSIRVEAQSDFRAARFYKDTQNPELSFKSGDVFSMVAVDEQAGWGFGELENNSGWFPLSFVKILTVEDPTAVIEKKIKDLEEKDKLLSEKEKGIRQKLEEILTEKQEIRREIDNLKKELIGTDAVPSDSPAKPDSSSKEAAGILPPKKDSKPDLKQEKGKSAPASPNVTASPDPDGKKKKKIAVESLKGPEEEKKPRRGSKAIKIDKNDKKMIVVRVTVKIKMIKMIVVRVTVKIKMIIKVILKKEAKTEKKKIVG